MPRMKRAAVMLAVTMTMAVTMVTMAMYRQSR